MSWFMFINQNSSCFILPPSYTSNKTPDERLQGCCAWTRHSDCDLPHWHSGVCLRHPLSVSDILADKGQPDSQTSNPMHIIIPPSVIMLIRWREQKYRHYQTETMLDNSAGGVGGTCQRISIIGGDTQSLPSAHRSERQTDTRRAIWVL